MFFHAEDCNSNVAVKSFLSHIFFLDSRSIRAVIASPVCSKNSKTLHWQVLKENKGLHAKLPSLHKPFKTKNHKINSTMFLVQTGS